MVVVPSSPREVVEFYQKAFVGIDQTMARMAAHNDIVEKLAAEANVPFIDTTPNLAGEWDEDLFLDPVHFTQKGSNRVAETMLSGLLPILRGNESLRCRERAISR
jgi:lysophospholipase L1-like esterase